VTKDQFLQRHTKLTRSLKKFILDYEGRLAAEVFEQFLESVHEELQKASQEILSASPGVMRALKLHELVEAEIAEGADLKVSCFKGCSACCHMEVEITSYEAEVLKQLLEEGMSIDRVRLQQQSQRAVQDPAWREGLRNEVNKCVFLDHEGACRIYENRPVMCRRHSVTSPAEACETVDGKIVLRYFPKVDLLISAANEDLEVEIGPLAKMLEMKLLQKP
jgi:uncharacterized protein